MRVLYLAILLLAVLAFIIGCKTNSGTRVVIYTKAPIKSLITIKRIPFYDEKEHTVDSAIVVNNHDSLILYIPETDGERLFKIEASKMHMPVTVINDSRLVRVHVDYFADTFKVEGSRATLSLNKFEANQEKLAGRSRDYYKTIDSLKKANKPSKLIDSMLLNLNKLVANINKQYLNYADTVTSPAAFIKAYNLVDFGDDYKKAKTFIAKVSKRFPNYKPVQRLVKEAQASIRVSELELNVGDQLPSVSLPDKDGKLYSTRALKGKYFLIDFWSTWCQQCYLFKIAEANFYKKYPQKSPQMIGVALDDNIDDWKKTIKLNQYPSIELIDIKMWQGPTVNAMVFDSIPFNFLVGPDGKIIDKAISPSKLETILLKNIK